MLKTILVTSLILVGLLVYGTSRSASEKKPVRNANNGILEKMIVANGTVTMDLDLARLGGSSTKGATSTSIKFDVEENTFFSIIVFNDELRGPIPSSMPLKLKEAGNLPARMSGAYERLSLDSLPFGGPYELVIRDGGTGMILFGIEGIEYNFDPASDVLEARRARLVMSPEHAEHVNRGKDAGKIVGDEGDRGDGG
jgi:hypothetical protein